jgi:hypothetical protein
MRLTRTAAGVLPAVLMLSGTVPAAAAGDPCFDAATVSATADTLTDRPAKVTVAIRGALCRDAAVTVVRSEGTNRQRVSLTQFSDGVGSVATYGAYQAPVANGAGTWLVTQVHSGTRTHTLADPYAFVVKRRTVVTVPRETWSWSGRTVTISGQARFYTSTGALAPLPNRTVRVDGQPMRSLEDPRTLARVTTDAAGRFRFSLRFTRDYHLYVRVWSAHPVIANGYAPADVRLKPGILLRSANPRPYVEVPTTIVGEAGPGTRTVGLLRYDDHVGRWIDTGARATTGSDGLFRLTHRPRPTGPATYALVPAGATAPSDDRFASPRFEVWVDPRPSRLTCFTGAKSDPVIRPGTTMSTYGHLRVMYTSGAIGPFPNQRVLVQTKPVGAPESAWQTAASATTTSTGYFYANWTVTDDVNVRAAFVENYQTIDTSYCGTGRVDVR